MALTRMIGFVVTTKPAEAIAFYGTRLGFRLVADDHFALVFDANGTMLRVVKAQTFTPQQGTMLGWEVENIDAAVADLAAHGISFNRYPGLPQDDAGIWNTPNGDRVAWFNDPDGNVLSISQQAVNKLDRAPDSSSH